MRCFVIVASIGVTCLSGAALAQTSAINVPGTLIEYDGWGLIPIFDGSEVHSFLALRDEDEIVGQNISAIWFQRQADDSWEGLAWNDGDHAAALKYVAMDLGLPEGWDENLVVEYDAFSATPISPKPYAYGLYADDPLTPAVAASSDPAAAAGALEGIGYAASSLGVVSGGGSSGGIGQTGCEYQLASTDLLDALANGEETELAQTDSFTEGVEQVISCCFPYRRTIPGPWSDWTCGPWAVVAGPGAAHLCRSNCDYERTVTRTRFLIRVIRWPNCSISLCTIWQTESGIETGSSTIDLSPYDCVLPPGLGCPGTPDTDNGSCGEPSNVTRTSTGC